MSDEDCAIAVYVRHVITSIGPPGIERRESIPFPPTACFTIDALALMFDVSPRRIYNVLWQYRARLGPRMYRQRRRDGDFRLYRIVSLKDLEVLRHVFRFIVK